MELINMEVKDVEFRGAAPDVLQHHQMIGKQYLLDLLSTAVIVLCREPGSLRVRISTRKQRYLMTQGNQLFRQIRYDALRPAIEFRRHSLK